MQRAHLVDEALTPQDLSVPESGPRRLPRPLPPGFGPGYYEEYPLFETAVGWSYLRLSPGGDLDELDSIDVPLGWNVSVAGNQTHWLGFVGDASGHYKDDFVLEGDRSMVHAVMGGVRASLRTKSVIVPFGQFLAGIVWSHVEVAGEREGSLDFAIQPGGGIDVGDGAFAARVEVGWRRVFYEDFVVEAPYKNQFRFVVGVVVRSF